MAARNIQVVIIDPQDDFMDHKWSALAVPGGNADMDRGGLMIKKNRRKINDIKVTLDSHQLLHIAHPAFWVGRDGKHPTPMITVITHDDVKNRIWTPVVESLREHALWYTKQLEAGGKFKLTIWNPHCLIGTPGHNVQANINDALQGWASEETGLIDYVTKGSNYLTEHFGALQAEVPLANDPGTQLNTDLLVSLKEADDILILGEAFSHCVKETVNQIADNIGAEHIKKLRLIKDCMSSIPAIRDATGGIIPFLDFPTITATWLKGMEKRGLVVTDSVAFWN